MGNFDRSRSRSGHHKAIASAVAFLREVGVDVDAAAAPAGCFFPGVWLDAGRLRYDPRVAHVGDLLHEAGHLAVLPARLRPELGPGDLHALPAIAARRAELLDAAMFAALDPEADAAGAIARLIDADEHAAVAWSYAAAFAANLDPGRVLDIVTWFQVGRKGPIPNGGRRIRRALDLNRHPGVSALVDAGMTTLADFPDMRRWLRP